MLSSYLLSYQLNVMLFIILAGTQSQGQVAEISFDKTYIFCVAKQYVSLS